VTFLGVVPTVLTFALKAIDALKLYNMLVCLRLILRLRYAAPETRVPSWCHWLWSLCQYLTKARHEPISGNFHWITRLR